MLVVQVVVLCIAVMITIQAIAIMLAKLVIKLMLTVITQIQVVHGAKTLPPMAIQPIKMAIVQTAIAGIKQLEIMAHLRLILDPIAKAIASTRLAIALDVFNSLNQFKDSIWTVIPLIFYLYDS